MQRKYYLPPTLAAFKAGRVPNDKFNKLNLADAKRFIKNYYPKDKDEIWFTHSWDFKFKTDLSEILAVIPEHVTGCRFNVHYLKEMTSEQLVALFNALPDHVQTITLDHLNQFQEFPHLDLCGEVEEIAEIEDVIRAIKAVPPRCAMVLSKSCAACFDEEELKQIQETCRERSEQSNNAFKLPSTGA